MGLPISGIPISCGTVQSLTQLEQKEEAWSQRMKEFDKNLEKKWETTSTDLTNKVKDIDRSRLLSLEDEDEEFMKEYKTE